MLASLPLTLKMTNQIKNLGVVIDSNLSFKSHITKSAYYYLKNISSIRGLISQQDSEKLVHALIFSRLSYSNAVFTGNSEKCFRQLQLIQNAAAWVIIKTMRVNHISPVLRSLHWLPAFQRIECKILLMVYKALNGLGPKCISDLLLDYDPFRPLRSSRTALLTVPSAKS